MANEKKRIKYVKHDGRYFEGDRRTCKKALAEHLIRQQYAIPWPEGSDDPKPEPEAAPEEDSSEDSEESGAEEEKPLAELDKAELVAIAKEKGIKHSHLMNQETLVARIESFDAADEDEEE